MSSYAALVMACEVQQFDSAGLSRCQSFQKGDPLLASRRGADVVADVRRALPIGGVG